MSYSVAAYVVLLMVGYVAGVAMLRKSHRHGQISDPICARCQYSLAGLTAASVRCPECGSELSAANIISPAQLRLDQRRWWIGHALVLATTVGAIPLWVILTFLASFIRRIF